MLQNIQALGVATGRVSRVQKATEEWWKNFRELEEVLGVEGEEEGCVCMYAQIRRHQYQHTRVHAHTGPRRHARAPACRRHHIPRLVRRQGQGWGVNPV